jgi:hypothetical protein
VSIAGACSRIACRWAGVLKRMHDILQRYALRADPAVSVRHVAHVIVEA